MNLLPPRSATTSATHGALTVPLPPPSGPRLTSDAVIIGVRPRRGCSPATGGLDVEVVVVEELGSESFLYCTDPSAEAIAGTQVVARTEG